MISNEGFISTHELAQFSCKQLADDRQEYIIEILNNIIASDNSSLEDKIIAFEKLGDLYWYYAGDLDKALEYINSAIDLSGTVNTGFSHVLRGDLWETRLKLLSLLGRNDEIEGELERILNKYANTDFESNSYLFNAYKYRADLEYKRYNNKAALENLMEAQMYYPVRFYADRLFEIEASDYKKEYENLNYLLSRNVCHPNDWEM